MHGFCVFLSFSIVCKYGVVAFYDDCEMLMIVRRIMGIIKLCIDYLLGQCGFYDGSLWSNNGNGTIRLKV
jgi:hypothetical protein